MQFNNQFWQQGNCNQYNHLVGGGVIFRCRRPRVIKLSPSLRLCASSFSLSFISSSLASCRARLTPPLWPGALLHLSFKSDMSAEGSGIRATCCHLIFALCSFKHSFHIMLRLWIWREMPTSRQLLSCLTSTCTFLSREQLFVLFSFLLTFTELRCVQSSRGSSRVTDLSVFLWTHQTNNMKTEQSFLFATRVEAQKAAVCNIYPSLSAYNHKPALCWLCS